MQFLDRRSDRSGDSAGGYEDDYSQAPQPRGRSHGGQGGGYQQSRQQAPRRQAPQQAMPEEDMGSPFPSEVNRPLDGDMDKVPF